MKRKSNSGDNKSVSLIIAWKLVGKQQNFGSYFHLYTIHKEKKATDKPFVDGRFRRAKRFKHSSEIEQLNSLGNRMLSWGKSPFVNVVVDFTIFKT